MSATNLRDAIRFRKNANQQEEQLRRTQTVENLVRRAAPPLRHTPETDIAARCDENSGALGAVAFPQVTGAAHLHEDSGTVGTVIPARRRSKGAARYGDHQTQSETEEETTPSQPQDEWIF